MSISPAQFALLVNRVTALDGINAATPSASAVPTIQADLNGLHTSLNQLVLTIQTQLNLVANLVTQLQGATNEILGGSGLAIPNYLVASLPVGIEGQLAYALDGRKIGEGSGAGTGVPVFYSNGFWRTYSTNNPVQS